MIRPGLFYASAVLVLFFVACHSGDKTVKPPPTSGQNTIESIKNEITKHPDSLMLKEKLIEKMKNTK